MSVIEKKPQHPDQERGTARRTFLLCPPDHFNIEYEINPWMKGNFHRAEYASAVEQWNRLRERIAEHADLQVLKPEEGVPDLVFTANAGLVVGKSVVLSRFRHQERQREEPVFKRWFEQNGFNVIVPLQTTYFEGAGDALLLRDRNLLIMGYGVRSSLEAAPFITRTLGLPVLPVRLIDKRFYHLDTCFCPLSGGYVIYYPDAFDRRSLDLLERVLPKEKTHAVSERDALDFACNAVDMGRAVILNKASAELRGVLERWGFAVVETPLTQFMLSGGSAKCLTLRLNEPLDAPNHAPDPSLEMHSRQMELTGHIIDSGILTRVMDLVPSMGGMFKVLRFDPGVRKEDSSSMVMEVTAPGEGLLEEVLLQLLSLGGRLLEPEAVPARLERVQKKGVAPRSFYSTTIFRTEILYQGRWLTAQKQRMDAAIVVEDHQDGPVVVCRLLRDLKVGDRVVVGSEGLRLHTRRTQQKDGDDFKFMGSGVSSERRVEAAVDMIAWEMRQIRSRGGRIVVVPGPVVVHTGGAPHLAALVRDGYVQALLGGNAIAVHDLESCLYGTSLGVDLQRGLPVTNGHRHHINTINIIREFGGIREAVDAGVITQGLFYEVIKSGIPFCLAGSIRDDGPLPETQMDLVIAQREYARLLEGAEMVLMLSSMLHSIGVGNMTPAGVRMVCVDINPAVATKLADRGSLDATPIVTDVGLFLNMLVRKIAELEDK